MRGEVRAMPDRDSSDKSAPQDALLPITNPIFPNHRCLNHFCPPVAEQGILP